MVIFSLALAAGAAYAVPTSPRGVSTVSIDNPVPVGKSPTTGLDWTGDYKPILVQINNYVPSRPQWNLSEADIVYEAINAGYGNGIDRRYHTRYTGVYSDNHPSFVGPVRSARIHHLSLRDEWDAVLVHWGGNDWKDSQGKPLITNILGYFKAHNISTSDPYDFSVDGANDGHDYNGSENNLNDQLTRSTKGEYARNGENNAIANLDVIAAAYWPKDFTAHSHAYQFTDTPSEGIDGAVEISIVYGDDFAPSYTYNPVSKVYERSYCGEPEIDGYTKKRIVASNVIVQRATTTFYNGMADGVLIQLVGEGEADLFIQGRHIPAKWVRKGDSDRTIFYNSLGVEIPLAPGKTWIQLITNTMDYTYTRPDGSVITQKPGKTASDLETMSLDPESEQRVQTESD